jgi:hypothetical protein
MHGGHHDFHTSDGRYLAFATLLADERGIADWRLGGSTQFAHRHLAIERFDPEFTGCPER